MDEQVYNVKKKCANKVQISKVIAAYYFNVRNYKTINLAIHTLIPLWFLIAKQNINLSFLYFVN